MNDKLQLFPLRRYRTDSILSFYDNLTESRSKWMIVRQRLPDILALSPTYKPSSVRSQIILLITLMHRQTSQLRRLSNNDYNTSLARISNTVIVNIGDRSRFIYLKRIPSEQMIHVDVDGLVFSIPTRQFIIAISQGYGHETAAKYCPPAIGDMLINLSKTKVADDGRQYTRALFKQRVGKMLFFSLYIFIIGMMLALTIGSAKTFLKLNSSEYNNPNSPIVQSLTTGTETSDYS
jgi:hypothetical protein